MKFRRLVRQLDLDMSDKVGQGWTLRLDMSDILGHNTTTDNLCLTFVGGKEYKRYDNALYNGSFLIGDMTILSDKIGRSCQCLSAILRHIWTQIDKSSKIAVKLQDYFVQLCQQGFDMIGGGCGTGLIISHYEMIIGHQYDTKIMNYSDLTR